MSGNAVIVFAKEPVKGQVKTRLGAEIGHDTAVDVYYQLLACTDGATKPFARSIFYRGNAERIPFFKGAVEWVEQSEGDLGQRMLAAFKHLFDQGAEKVLIVGSDCPKLKANIIEQAFQALDDHPYCLGPALDGGYYLLGMKELNPELFGDIPWSTDQVARLTLERMGEGKCFQLPELRDLDRLEDLDAFEWDF